MKKIIFSILGMGISFFIFIIDFYSVMATSPVPTPNFSYTPTHTPAHIVNPADDFYAPVPMNSYSPALSPAEKSNISTIVESSEFQEVVIDMFEEGATYGVAQKGYTVNSSIYEVSPEATGVMAMYGGYQVLYSLYGDSPDYQAFIAPYKQTDADSYLGDFLPMNTILGTFVYGEIRLDAAIDSATGEIKAAYLSFQDGFEQSVDKLLSKLNNNFYCPVAPPAECEEYGLTQLASVPAYSVNLRDDGRWGQLAIIFPTADNLNGIPEDNFVCFLKNKTDSDITRQLVVVIKEEYYNVRQLNQGGITFSLAVNSFNEGLQYSYSALDNRYNVDLQCVARSSGYCFYTTRETLHFMTGLQHFYNFPYCSYNMSLNDFIAYYVDNAGELSVGGVSFTPVQPSSQAFPQPGNVYNPADLQEYNENQREKIEECPIIKPETAPYPGSEPAPGVEPEKRTLPQIVPDPATGGITVVPLPTPEPSPSPGGEPVIDPDTGGEVDKGSLSPYMFDLSKKFPFCVPFDLIECVKIMKQKPVAPSFEWTMEIKMIDFKYTFRIDLKSFEPAAKVCRIMFTLLFIVSLIMVTRSMIRG